MTRIKICGNRNMEDLNYAIACGADAVGFITDVPVRSIRKIDVVTAKDLIEQVPVFVDSVLVIMPDDLDSAMALIQATRPACVQIHNDLPISDLAAISKTVKLIKTISVPDDAAQGTADRIMSRIDSLIGIADAILLDTRSGSGSGGTGKMHDWGISAEIVRRSRLPVLLAGGLTPDNVEDAVRQVHPYAVDTASGVETDGKRDRWKVRRFIRQCVVADGVADDG